ncbi:NAD(P)-binding protein [Zopfia rhizophila CBS 207.26]|uniref:NAD(P)-binding protein n=1 Tax=Zopfia rhizophila CBS 207.26 TaxID=1314779 RepID=A0A6A6E866_9PEZI|nr:NAD(P)-binding protein [Zopfia rhizophila CBS 207.26]
MSKLITIFGATGAQGGSLVRSLLQNKSQEFTLRGITRNPSSDSAKKLSDLGVEVVKADGFNKEEMIAAFKGSWGVFVNTNSDDPALEKPDAPTELDLGKLIVDAAVEAGVQHFVYSGMASAAETTGGKIPVDGFEHKHGIGEYAKSTNAFKTVVIPSAGWYMENFLIQDLAPVFGGFPYIPSETGELVFRCPHWGGKEDIPFIAMGDDFGDIVHGIFLSPEKWNDKLVQGVSNISSLEDAIQAFEKVTGKKARFEELPKWQDFETYGMRSLETIKGMFGFCQESGGRYYGVETESSTAAELKKAAADAQGKSGDEAKLLTLEAWFKREFGGK